MMAPRDSEIRDKDIRLYSSEDPFDWGTLVMPTFALCLALLGFAFLSTIFIRNEVEDKVEAYLKNRPEGEIAYSSMKASVLWDTFELRDVVFKPKGQNETAQIRRLVIRGIGRETLYRISKKGLRLPPEFKIEVVGFSAPASLLSSSTAAYLRSLGYKELSLTGSTQVTYNTRAAQLSFSNGVFDFNDAHFAVCCWGRS
ncbi:MAG: hypothetical protein V4692_01425, partial [Bdellovibrionota bacterium]